MRLNTIKPAPGEKKSSKRVGRGIGSGLGKTCGRGHKGQSARAGGFHKVGFEGGQMPMQRRLPKIGFASLSAGKTAELTLSELAKIGAQGAVVDLAALKLANLIPLNAERVKVIQSGSINNIAVKLSGIAVTKGARSAIEAAGGKVEA